MFNCYAHGWSSHDGPCPLCKTVITTTSTAVPDRQRSPSTPSWHLANLKAWVHNAKKNPLSEAQLEFAESIEIALEQARAEGRREGLEEFKSAATYTLMSAVPCSEAEESVIPNRCLRQLAEAIKKLNGDTGAPDESL